MIRASLLAAALSIAACDSMPSDPDGTLERIRREGVFKVGLIESHAAPDSGHALLGRLSRATGARPAVERGSAESLLTKLEEGSLDLVLGEFAEKSPWAAKVTLSEPIESHGPTSLAAAARNGENAWIGLVHREAEAAAR